MSGCAGEGHNFLQFKSIHPGANSVDGLGDSTRVINFRIDAAHPWIASNGTTRVDRSWIDNGTEEELVQYVYTILQDHGLSTSLGACTSIASPFVLNLNKAGANAGLGTWSLYIQLHDRLARDRGHRGVEHDLRATKKTKYDLGTSTFDLGTSKHDLGTSKHDLGTSKHDLGTSSVPHFRVTHERKLLCPVCQNEFAPSDTVMAKFDKPHEHMIRDRAGRKSTWPTIKCKNKSCRAGLSTSPTASRRIYEVNSLS